MPTVLRLVHRDDSKTVTAALDPSNPLASVPELPVVSFADAMVGWQQDSFYEAVRRTRLVFSSDLFRTRSFLVQTGLLSLARMLKEAGIDPKTVTFITDWESWEEKGKGQYDYQWWRSSMSAWPGPIGNYGNAEGKHVEEHPGNRVALSWPWLKDIPNALGVSCPSAYNLGLSVDGLRKTIAVARSRRFYLFGQPRKTVVFIADPMYHDDRENYTYGLGTQLEYLKAASAADYVILWPISPRHDPAYSDFGNLSRLGQDAITAMNLRRLGWLK